MLGSLIMQLKLTLVESFVLDNSLFSRLKSKQHLFHILFTLQTADVSFRIMIIMYKSVHADEKQPKIVGLMGLDISSLERLYAYLINTNEKLKNFKMRPRDLIQVMHSLHYPYVLDSKCKNLNHKITSSIFKSIADF